MPGGIAVNARTFVQAAQGALTMDVDNNVFIDFAGSLPVGHSHPKIQEALQRHIDSLLSTGSQIMKCESNIKLAERLAALSPGLFEKKILFQNSGPEAMESAVQLARRYTKKAGIVTFSKGFHGRTFLTGSMSSKGTLQREGPFAQKVYKAPFPYDYRRPDTMGIDEYERYVLEEFHQFMNEEMDLDNIAAVVMEPVQNEGGIIVPGKKFVQEIAKICREKDILFIADETRTGFGLTGTYFAMEHFDVSPDLTVIPDAIGGGIPLSGVIGRAKVMDVAAPGELADMSTGGTLGCAAALALLDILKTERLLQRAKQIEEMVMKTLREFEDIYECVGNVRGLGAICGMEIVGNKELKTPDKELTSRIIESAFQKGLLIQDAGIYSNVIRIMVPLVITDEQLMEGLGILGQCLKECTAAGR